jgi:hypothetical protein
MSPEDLVNGINCDFEERHTDFILADFPPDGPPGGFGGPPMFGGGPPGFAPPGGRGVPPGFGR